MPLMSVIGAPSLTGFSPTLGAAGTTVTITGDGFDTTPGNNTVKFNGATATVSAATATQLTVTVPATASTGAITVTTPNGTGSTTSVFTVAGSATSTYTLSTNFSAPSLEAFNAYGTSLNYVVSTSASAGYLQIGQTAGMSYGVYLTSPVALSGFWGFSNGNWVGTDGDAYQPPGTTNLNMAAVNAPGTVMKLAQIYANTATTASITIQEAITGSQSTTTGTAITPGAATWVGADSYNAFFGFTTASATTQITVNLSNMTSGADLELWQNGTVIASTTDGADSQLTKQAVFTGLTGGAYYTVRLKAPATSSFFGGGERVGQMLVTEQ